MNRDINESLEKVLKKLEPVEETRMPRGIKATMDQLHVDFRALEDDIKSKSWQSADSTVNKMLMLLRALRGDIDKASST